MAWHKAILEHSLTFFRSIGRAVLEIHKDRDTISDSTALLWGIIVLLIILLFLIGLLPLGWLMKLGSHWLGSL